MEEKKKATIYITKEDENKINCLRAMKLIKNKPATISDVICSAIEEVYVREYGRDNKKVLGKIND